MIFNTVLDAMGNTPMIRLNRMTGPDDAEVLVKYEGLNIGGSIKTRTAFQMIEAAERAGILKPDSVIVEPTSGNQGIGLALVGAVKGYRVVIIMPDSVSQERRLLIRHYGAEVMLIHDEDNIGECIDRCIQKAREMAAADPKVFMPNQFSNPENLNAHYLHTAREILGQVDGPIDGFCSGIGTGGTITGIGNVLKKANPQIAIWAAEPENAAILSGGSIGSHLQMGIGDGLIPPILDQSVYQQVEIVKDEQAIETTRQLAAKEGILCGISSGTNVCVALRLAKHLGRGKRVVTILPDTGERYFSTELFHHE
ncbi:MAG: cysteine synthase A [Oscillospiraceae bacterium]|nr:cysteine synthase A [Oscillospiraceae bacterium]